MSAPAADQRGAPANHLIATIVRTPARRATAVARRLFGASTTGPVITPPRCAGPATAPRIAPSAREPTLDDIAVVTSDDHDSRSEPVRRKPAVSTSSRTDPMPPIKNEYAT